MADNARAQCGHCECQSFFVKRMAGDRGEPIFLARCCDCSIEYRLRLEPEIRWIDDLPF